MRKYRGAVRRAVLGLALSLAIAVGTSACGSSSKTDSPGGHSNSPGTTKAPSGGGASY